MDSKEKVGSPDRGRINVHEDYELQYWSEKFGVTRDELRDAVKEVGPTVKAVTAYFERK